MANPVMKACFRCHKRKVKCSGYPDCEGCSQSRVYCQPYHRPKRNDTLQAFKQAQQRVKWLEHQLSIRTGVNVGSMETDAVIPSRESAVWDPQIGSCPLQVESQARVSPTTTHEDVPVVDNPAADAPAANGINDIHTSPATEDAPEISLLALNATGELKYLGPSSGAFFASYATALVRSCASGQHLSRASLRQRHGGEKRGTASGINIQDDTQPLSTDEVDLLRTSYEMWIHPLHPMMCLAKLRRIVSQCRSVQNVAEVVDNQSVEQDIDMAEMAIFYLIMALGATNRTSTANHLQRSMRHRGIGDQGHGPAPSPTYLYTKALRCFDAIAENLHPSTVFIQIILLICIYSSHGSIGSSQWQLSGLAMRMAVEIGLHYSPKTTWQASPQVLDERNRVFWTAYAIEISLAYNLGRPPSIADEHILAAFPNHAQDTTVGIHYIRHRQIQSRIVSKVYIGTARHQQMSMADRHDLISDLQFELDDWAEGLSTLCSADGTSPYPHSYWARLYHGTAFVLHRTSPLCPTPSADSVRHCIRFAGLYIDDMADILRNSNVPLSWMLVQGIIFAGMTMLITARTGFRKICSRGDFRFLLVDLPAWARKCSVCLAIVNERWQEDLVSELDAQFEALADDTIKVVSTGLISQPPDNASSVQGSNLETPFLPSVESNVTIPASASWITSHDPLQADTSITSFDTTFTWDGFDVFREFLGMDGSQTFWDIFPTEG